MKLSDAVNAIQETWSGSTLADLDANPEYLRGQVELVLEMGSQVEDDLGIFHPDDDGDSRKEALTQHIREKRTNPRLSAARRRVNDEVRGLFRAEINNERNGGITPATLSSTIDSVMQMPEDLLDAYGDPKDVYFALLMIRDLLPGHTEVRDLL